MNENEKKPNCSLDEKDGLRVLTPAEKLDGDLKIVATQKEIASINLKNAETQLEICKESNKRFANVNMDFIKSAFDKSNALLWLVVNLEIVQFVIHIIETYF